ncbi:MAG: Rieske 2Fe-2S domain-containing protein [bacterium]|nr:Rieske 2Fe-2S domain-containing protein [bacterium]
METPGLKRSFFQRILGICATKPPSDEGCWDFSDGKITVDLDKAPELSSPNGAVRLESKDLSERVLLVRGDDGYHAFLNCCTHMGRRMDPVPGANTIQCCSIGKSTFTYEGGPISGTAQKKVHTLPVTLEEGKLVITL